MLVLEMKSFVGPRRCSPISTPGCPRNHPQKLAIGKPDLLRRSSIGQAKAPPPVLRQATVNGASAKGAQAVKYSLQGLLSLPKLILRGALTQLAALGLSAILLHPAVADTEVFRFPASERPEVYAAQRTLLEAWSIIEQHFVDQGSLSNWDQVLGDSLTAAYTSTSGDVAYHEIEAMIRKLNDPYTRIIPPREYADFRVSSDGEVQGVGMLIASDPSTGRLMVLTPLSNSPAARAGVQSGDEVVSIDGHSVHGWDGDKAAHFLRGRSGSSVNVRLARRTSQVPGVAGRPDPPLVYTEYKQVNLKRERLELSPVYSTALMHDDHKVGYIRLTSFSQKAAADMKRHISKLEKTGAEAYILDLRNNPGGLVRSGLDIARLFLDGQAAIFNVSGRDGGSYSALMQKVVLEEGRAQTQRPLAVLVNSNSASASEILAGALHDNSRAAIIGDRTYGKGKIQSVFELQDGSALFVTVARYKTPLFLEIDQVGIVPDESCRLGKGSVQAAPGLPLDAESAIRVSQQLMTDSCVAVAEDRLEAMMATPDTNVWHPATNTWSP